MPNGTTIDQQSIRSAFTAEESRKRITNTKVGCALVVTLMPAGTLLDSFVYPESIWPFFWARWICSALAAGIWLSLYTPLGQRSVGGLGLIVPLLPVVFIAAMIGVEDGFNSTYYAGLNLCLLAVGAVLHWSVSESIVGVLLVLGLYIFAGWVGTKGPVPESTLVGNFYFIALMDVIVVVGTYFQAQARFREFCLRHELDANRRELQDSNEKLKELDQIKTRFFANISHELRTPLTLLLAPLETLIERFSSSLDKETGEVLATMRANGMRLLKLINDLLDLVRLESGRMEVKREPLDVDSFVKGLAAAARQVAEDKRLRLETIVDPALGTVLADGDKLEKIVLNLVFNALKFTPAGGKVEVRAAKEGEEFVLRVSDTGIGISAKNLPHVFDRFWQADDSSKRKYQGVGIGLALVKELTEIQGGSVIVESKEGKGTSFILRFPYAKAESNAGPAVQTAPPSAAGSAQGQTVTSEEWLSNLYRRAELFPALTPVRDAMRPVETWANGNQRRVLVADDEPDMLRFLKSQLATHYQVIEAVDGQQAVDKASQFLPDLILLDMMMPEKDGIQACQELRERTSTQNIPVVLLTARADEQTKMAALKAGASDFLAKPFSTTELHVRIKNLVESYEYQRKLGKQNHVLENTIEQLKETETELVQSEKLASLGRWSAGIIHEINNPLNFATTGLFTLRSKEKFLAEDQRSDYAEILNDIEEGIKRVRDLVSSLRTFSYADNERPQLVQTQEIITPALRFLSHEWKDKVHIVQNINPEQTVWANKNKLIQVLVNLLQNSLDALARKGTGEHQPTIWIEGQQEGTRSVLIIRDNGTGIDPEHMDKIFDPFYTTKDVGQGMGLGLSICYRIVQEYHGRIDVKSEPGQSCQFTLEFPAAAPETQDTALSA